jgi:hypothetical protein
VPVQVTHRLDRAFEVLADARASSARPARRRYGQVGRILKQAANRARRYARIKKPRLSAACADELGRTIEAIIGDTAAECVGRGFCTPH